MTVKKKVKKRRSAKSGERLRKKQRDADAPRKPAAAPEYMPAYASSNLASGGGSVGFGQPGAGLPRVQPYNSIPYQNQIQEALVSVSSLGKNLQETKQLSEIIGKQAAQIELKETVMAERLKTQKAEFDLESYIKNFETNKMIYQFEADNALNKKLSKAEYDRDLERATNKINLDYLASIQDTKLSLNNQEQANKYLTIENGSLVGKLNAKRQIIDNQHDQLIREYNRFHDLRLEKTVEIQKLEDQVGSLNEFNRTQDEKINSLYNTIKEKEEETIELRNEFDDFAKKAGLKEEEIRKQNNLYEEDIFELRNIRTDLERDLSNEQMAKQQLTSKLIEISRTNTSLRNRVAKQRRENFAEKQDTASKSARSGEQTSMDAVGPQSGDVQPPSPEVFINDILESSKYQQLDQTGSGEENPMDVSDD